MSLILNDIRYFITVTDTLNVTRASEIIGISQPALSYAIKRLENELGGEVIIRLKNGIQLTKLGEEFKQRARRLLHEWEQAQNLANSELGLIQGSYSIAVHPSVALYSLELFLPQLQVEFPKLDFNFIHGLSREMTEKVINWEADFGIVVNPITHPDLVVSELCHDEVSIFYTGKPPNKLIHDHHLAQSRYILKKLGKQVTFESMFCSSNLEVVAKLTSLGLGYGLLPSRVAAQYKQLIRLDGTPIYKDKICLVYRPEKHKNLVSKNMIQIIRSSMTNQD